MDQYFSRMRSLMNNKDLPARIRFLLQDTVELRENNWVPRKAFIDNGPKTINQIRQDAVKVRAPFYAFFSFSKWWKEPVTQFLSPFQDLGMFIPAMTPGMRTDFFQDNPFLPTRLSREVLGGLADMFGQMPGTLWSFLHVLSFCLSGFLISLSG